MTQVPEADGVWAERRGAFGAGLAVVVAWRYRRCPNYQPARYAVGLWACIVYGEAFRSRFAVSASGDEAHERGSFAIDALMLKCCIPCYAGGGSGFDSLEYSLMLLRSLDVAPQQQRARS